MAETKTTGELTGIEVTTGQNYSDKVINAVPIVGGAVKTYETAAKAAQDGSLSPGDMQEMHAQTASFIQSCGMTAMEIATDPLGWLISNGLDFLISIIQPLQDALHFVTGDGPALEQAAGNFANIGKGLEKHRDKFDQDLTAALQNWGGGASEMAGTQLAEFADGIDGVAGQAGDISHLLQNSSMFMKAIEDFIMMLLTEFVKWMIMIWIPALAAAGPTFGASTAAAGSATAVRAGTTTARATRQVGKLQRLLQKLMDLLRKLRDLMARSRARLRRGMDMTQTRVDQVAEKASRGEKLTMRDKMYGPDGEIGSRLRDPNTGQPLGFGDSAKNVAGGWAEQQASAVPSSLNKASQQDQIGTEQSQAETEEQLDL